MKLGGDYGGISKRISRIELLKALQKQCPEIISELDESINDAKIMHINIMSDIEVERQGIIEEQKGLDRLIENYEANNPYPETDPDAPKLPSRKMTDKEWEKYQENYETDCGRKPKADNITRTMVDEWRKGLYGTTKEQREWSYDYGDLHQGFIEISKRLRKNMDLYCNLNSTRGFYKHIRDSKIKKSVDYWSEKHNLESWVANALLYCIAWWSRPDGDKNDIIPAYAIIMTEEEKELEINSDTTSNIIEEFEKRTPKFSFITPFKYNPFDTSRVWYKKITLELMEKKLDKYLDDLETEAIATNSIRTPETRNVERFEWLVRYQVCGESYNQIAKAVHASREAVRDRIRETAEWCDITLRPPGKPGRPKKD